MKFLILFFTLMIQHYRGISRSTTQSRTFSRWFSLFRNRAWFQKMGRNGRYALVVFVPGIIIGGSFLMLEDTLWGLPSILAEVALLLYVLSYADFHRYVDEYKQKVSSGDDEGAFRCADQYIAIPEIELCNKSGELHDQVSRTVLHRWFEFFFLMVFWFLVFGAPGVLIAWFSLQYSQLVHCEEKAWRPMHWLSWIPARLLGLTFALVGNFVGAIAVWKKTLWNWRLPADVVLNRVALAALSYELEPQPDATEPDTKLASNLGSKDACDQMDKLQLLHTRSVVVWLVIIALITIVGGTLY